MEEKAEVKEAASEVKEEGNGVKEKEKKSTKLKMNLLPNEHSLLEHFLSYNISCNIILNCYHITFIFRKLSVLKCHLNDYF